MKNSKERDYKMRTLLHSCFLVSSINDTHTHREREKEIRISKIFILERQLCYKLFENFISLFRPSTYSCTIHGYGYSEDIFLLQQNGNLV